ncbi:MAG: preprotein translocase subunit SecA, partial [Oscillospiraceae bacterium]|nr:preprotein translocase subunit SecA [Oscillospiraceae bacterium]
MSFLKSLFGNYSKRELKRINPIKDAVLALEQKYKAMSEADLKAQTALFKGRLKKGETLDDILPEAFAACKEAAGRVLNMRHFPVQIIGGIVLHQGRVAEMRTGEGKTLVETLPAYLNGLTGLGVHVITVNDYLAKRDADLMGKVFRFLGLTVGVVVANMSHDRKKEAYNADITYSTNSELGFDYLRDNMVQDKGEKVQRGHNFVIIDEVDSILIDEARTPLIISGPGDKSTQLYTLANNFAKTLSPVTVAEVDSKEDTDELYKDSDYIIDEKAKTATLTPKGVEKAEKFFNIDNITDVDNISIQHHVNQAIRANGVMKRDIDYVVKDGEVLIVDEHTGRLMHGRRYNEGLHQAIEAKEGVKIERESKTLASVTFQNYFKLYSKLSGMTGTGSTEEEEFREIYKLDIVQIPTNNPVKRIDYPDSLFKTEEGKFSIVIKDIVECHKKGQPVLVGTVSIEKSEVLSKLLSSKGIDHKVLNAKYHEREAEIVAQAGKKGAVTIATNMAGRGTDIKLGGNADFLARAEMRRSGFSEDLINDATGYADTSDEEILNARRTYAELVAKHKEQTKKEYEEVKRIGGLFIMGTERHESRRIDNQLRGRAGRQGDPGATRFYLSLQDPLMRLFGGQRMQKLMTILKIPDDEPINDKMLSRSIESAQSAVEGRNFHSRKSVLQYDDVLSKQRYIIYGQRDKVINGENIRKYVINIIKRAIFDIVSKYLPTEKYENDWNFQGLRDYFLGWMLTEDDFKLEKAQLKAFSAKDIEKKLQQKAISIYEEREKSLGDKLAREIERVVLLRNVDEKWMDHIDAMEELKQGIRLRAYGQKDPVVEYRLEGFEMFDDMISSICEGTTKILLSAKVGQQGSASSKKVAQINDVGNIRIPISSSSEFSKDLTPSGFIKKDAQINDVSKIRIPISSSSEFSKDLTPSNFIKRRKKQGR